MAGRQARAQHAGPQQREAANGLSLIAMQPKTAMAKVSYLSFTGSIDTPGVTRIAVALNNALNNGCEEVHLCFSSLGGYVADGIYLHNHIRGLPLKVVAYNVGSVSSIAATVFLAAEERYCSSHAMFMIHSTTRPAQEGMGAGRLQSVLDAALADDRRTENILRERTLIPHHLLIDRQTRDVHINPAQAVEYGIAHEVREFLLPRGVQITQA